MPTLSTGQITGVGIGAIVVLVLIAVLVAAFVTKLVVKALVTVVVVVLAIVVWTHRTDVVEKAQQAAASCDITFFGFHVKPTNEAVLQACGDLSGN